LKISLTKVLKRKKQKKKRRENGKNLPRQTSLPFDFKKGRGDYREKKPKNLK